MIDRKDAEILGHIVLALDRVGGELDAADRMPGHDPWSAIAGQEAHVRSLAKGLSGRFCRAHGDLAARLLACANLHLAWGSLRDEIEQRTQPSRGPGTVIPDDGG